MQLLAIFLGLSALVSSLNTGRSIEIRTPDLSLDRRDIATSISEFPDLLVTIEKQCYNEIVLPNKGSDRDKRQRFTQRFVELWDGSMSNDLGQLINAIIVDNNAYTADPAPLWSSDLLQFEVKVGNPITYSVIIMSNGTFTNKGDGGFENWAARTSDSKCTRPAENVIHCNP